MCQSYECAGDLETSTTSEIFGAWAGINSDFLKCVELPRYLLRPLPIRARLLDHQDITKPAS